MCTCKYLYGRGGRHITFDNILSNNISYLRNCFTFRPNYLIKVLECSHVSMGNFNHAFIFSTTLIVFCFVFSEENVWKLCERIRDEGVNEINKYSVVFISNHGRHVSAHGNTLPMVSYVPTVLVLLVLQNFHSLL
jgi:hypothetical protein